MEKMYNKLKKIEIDIIRCYIDLGLENNKIKYNLLYLKLKLLKKIESNLLKSYTFSYHLEDYIGLLDTESMQFRCDKNDNSYISVLYHVMIERLISIYKTRKIVANNERLLNAYDNDTAKKALLILKKKIENSEGKKQIDLIEIYYLYISMNMILENEFFKDSKLLDMENIEHKEIKSLYEKEYEEFLIQKQNLALNASTDLINTMLSPSLKKEDKYIRFCNQLLELTLEAYMSSLSKEDFAFFKSKVFNSIKGKEKSIDKDKLDRLIKIFDSIKKDSNNSKVIKVNFK